MTANPPDNLPIKYAGWLGGPDRGWYRPGWGLNNNFAMPVSALSEAAMPMTVQTSTIRVANDGQARESANPVGTATGHPAHDGQCGRADSRGRHGNTFPKGRWS